MAILRNTTPNALSGSLSATKTLSGSITVGDFSINIDMSDYYTKGETDTEISNATALLRNELSEDIRDLNTDTESISSDVDELTAQIAILKTNHNNDKANLDKEINDLKNRANNLENMDNTLEVLIGTKADKKHTHDEYALSSVIPNGTIATEDYVDAMYSLAKSYTDSEIKNLDIPESDLSNYATLDELNNGLNSKADKNHNHDITWNGGESVDLQTAFDYAASAINNKASTSYVDDAINTALGNIESQLDEIIGEEV